MAGNEKADLFLSQYSEEVFTNALKLREVVLANLPDIIEQLDVPAKMLAYCYGQKYTELICVIIPSKKGLKLGFNAGTELPDPSGLLEGTGKISRYVVIENEKIIGSAALKKLIKSGLAAYKKRIKDSVKK
jgi:hypothetical protein